jgi:hypothetical protein
MTTIIAQNSMNTIVLDNEINQRDSAMWNIGGIHNTPNYVLPIIS